MTLSQRFYLPSKYEFPDENLLKCGPDDLRAIIGSRLSTAQYKVDGLEGMTPEMVFQFNGGFWSVACMVTPSI